MPEGPTPRPGPSGSPRGGGLPNAARFLLVDCVETYVQWNDAARLEYERLLAEEGNQEVATMQMTWSERMREEGRQEGRQSLLLDVLRQRFGKLSPETEQHVREITSAEELSRLAGEVVAGRKPPELGL